MAISYVSPRFDLAEWKIRWSEAKQNLASDNAALQKKSQQQLAEMNLELLIALATMPRLNLRLMWELREAAQVALGIDKRPEAEASAEAA